MGKSLQSAGRLKELSRIVSSAKPQRPKQTQPAKPGCSIKVESPRKEQCRAPLATVVADCAKRWFQETLKEAKAGDAAMQVLVGQMYYGGYGVPRDPKKVWFFVHLILYMCNEIHFSSIDWF